MDWSEIIDIIAEIIQDCIEERDNQAVIRSVHEFGPFEDVMIRLRLRKKGYDRNQIVGVMSSLRSAYEISTAGQREEFVEYAKKEEE